MSDSTTGNNTNSSSPTDDGADDDFVFKYTESGGLTARYLLILFDSKTNILTSSTDISGSNLYHHQK
jgi:hypothetical protein